MKKILLILAVAFSAGIIAQNSIQLKDIPSNTTLMPNATIYTVTPGAGGNVKVYVDIKNIGATTNTYIVKRYDMTLHTIVANSDEAAAYFCFGGLCFGPPTLTASIVLRSNKSASDTTAAYFTLMADLDEASAIGFSHVRYTFYNKANTADSVQINVKYNDPNQPTAIHSIAGNKMNVTVYPNPANNEANIKVVSQRPESARLSVTNAIGQVVYSKETEIGEGVTNVPVDVKALSAGIYIVNVETSTGNTSRKLTVTK